MLPSGTPYLVLEYLEGEDLAQRLARGTLPLPAALAIARQIGSALHAAHQADVVHRDLKPDNIFLVPTEIGGELVDQVKVLDFGISKIRGSQTVQTQDSVLLGTPQYMAPEQALGKNSEIDARTDVFALGAIVYEMLAGRAGVHGRHAGRGGVQGGLRRSSRRWPMRRRTRRRTSSRPSSGRWRRIRTQRFADVAAFIDALTGRPLQTLDRARAKNPAPEAFASTQAAEAPSPPGEATTGRARRDHAGDPDRRRVAAEAKGIGRQEGGVHRRRRCWPRLAAPSAWSS